MNFNIGQKVRVLLGLDQADGLRFHLIRGATGTLILAVVGNISALIISVVLARLMGAEEFGIYAYTMAVVNLLFVLSTLGLSQLIIREVSVYKENQRWGLLQGLLKRAYVVTFIASVAMVFSAFIFASVMKERIGGHAFHVFLIGLILLPLLVLTYMREATARGLGYILLSQVPMAIIRPFLFLMLIGAAYLFWGNDSFATRAMTMQVIATAVPLVIIIAILWKVLPSEAKNAQPVFQTKLWMRSAWPLLFVSAMLIVNHQTDILMLGAIENTKEVGIYRVAQRGAGLISFGLAAVNMAIGPTISTLYTKGEMHRLQRIVTRSAQVALVFSLPLVLGLVIFGSQIVPFVYGSEFSPAATPLAILCVAQLLATSMGSVGLLLTMCGHERDTAKGFAFAAIINIILNAFLIPMWGGKGAAIATGISMISWSVLLAILAFRRLGISTTVFGRLS